MATTTQNVLGISLSLAAAAIIGAVAVMQTRFGAVSLDPETLCPTERPVVSHVALLVDRTDPLTTEHARTLRAAIDRVVATLPLHGRLSIHLVTADPAEAAVPALDRCNPGDGSLVDPLWGNPRRARQRFETGFVGPLETLLEALQAAAVAPRRPIIEAVATVAGGLDAHAAVRRIVVFSDLMQNTPDHSHYHRLPTAAAALRTPAGRRLAASSFAGAHVELVYLAAPAARHRQGPDHLAFWVELLDGAGARVAPPAADAVRMVRR